MSRLLEIQELLQDTGAAIARIEPSLAESPNRPSLLFTLQSLRKRQGQLEAEFLDAANQIGEDVCSYRLLPDETIRLTISALAKALGDFQHLFSVTYDAIKNGPKERASIGAEVAENTAFGFGYTFAGSVGVVFTLPNERLLADFPSDLDRAVSMIFQIAKINEPNQIAPLAKEIGRPPIQAIYTWARDHAQHGLGASIEWRRNKEIRNSLLIQQPELDRLHKTIALSSEESQEEVTVRGLLEAADVRRHRFEILTEEGGAIKGSFENAISESHVVTIPKRYTATIRKTTRLIYATDTEESSYFLVGLEPI